MLFYPGYEDDSEELIETVTNTMREKEKGFPIESELSTRAKWTLMSSKSEVMMLQIAGRDRFPGFDSENGRNSLED